MDVCMYHLLIDFEIWELADVRSKCRSEREKRRQDKYRKSTYSMIDASLDGLIKLGKDRNLGGSN